MSGPWEVVGSKRKENKGSNKLEASNKGNSTSNQPVITRNKKNNNVFGSVKIEEVLPKSQVQNIYNNNKIKENKTQEKQNHSEAKKPEKKVSKPQEPSKPKPPKSIESALNLVNLEEFKSVFEKSKCTYPEAPIVWLKELVQYLNQKITVDVQDPVFSSKPQGYPLNVVPPGIKSIIEQSVNEAGKNNVQLFFDIALTSMVTDMSKGLPAVGYRFYLQYIALSEPKMIVSNIKKHVTLRSSYQNRANIGLSILWAVGHVGINDLESGLTVFQELMLPVLELKSYSHFVLKYLLDLISCNIANSTLSEEQYILLLDSIFVNKKSCSSELQAEIVKHAPNLKTSLLRNKDKYHSYVETFLVKITTNSDKTYQSCLCDVLVTIFGNDPTTLNTWNKFYTKFLTSSAVLLDYIGSNNNNEAVKKVMCGLRFSKQLDNFIGINSMLLEKKRKYDGLKECMNAIPKITKAKSQKIQKKGGFISSLFKFVFIMGCLGVLLETLYKVQQGRAADSSFTKINNGIIHGLTWTNDCIEKKFPKEHKVIAEFSAPYIELAGDLGKVFCNAFMDIKESLDPYAKEKLATLRKTIDAYAPGLIEHSQKGFNNICKKTALFYNKGVLYLQEQVFVGQLSPDNMQRVVIEAYNTTSHKATEYYHWLCEKVQTAIK